MVILHEILVGDWSCDGHGSTKTYIVATEDGVSLRNLYSSGCSKIGHEDIHDEYCNDYEDNILPGEIATDLYAKFMQNVDILHKSFSGKLPISVDDVMEELKSCKEDDTNEFYVNPDTWVMLYLMICAVAGKNVTFTFPTLTSTTIGGYGLFINR